MDVKATSLPIIVRLITVNTEHGKQSDELHALAHNIGQGDIVTAVVIRGQVEHTPGQGVHNILAGCLQNNITHKIGGQRAVIGQLIPEAGQLRLIGQMSQQQKVSRLFKAIAFILQSSLHQLFYINSPVIELSVAGNLFPIHHFLRYDIGNLCQSR